MPVLANAKYERFAQGLADGMTADKAFIEAGFAANRGNAIRLKQNPDVQARIVELLGNAAERVEITKARVMAELARIGFSDIRNAVQWRSNVAVAAIDNRDPEDAFEEDGEFPEVRHQISNQVELIDSSDIDDDTAAAISEVSMTDKGAIKVKFHNKIAALGDLAKILGMFKEDTAPPALSIAIDDKELARLLVFQLTKASREP